MDQFELNVNLYAQDRMDKEEVLKWYELLGKDEKKHSLNRLHWFIINVKPAIDEIEISIINSKLKRSFTPIVLILKNPIKISIPKILNLPENEWLKSFTLVLEVFKTADTRRRLQECKGKCSHPWHNIE